jgi:hypothetical protein
VSKAKRGKYFDMTRHLKSWLPLLVAAVAIAFRFPLLDSLPPGLNFDEGGEGVAAMDVAQGHFRIWWPIGGGKEPLMAYLVQPLFWLFGPTRLALRLYTALMGVGAVLMTYFLAGQLFPTEEDTDAPFSLLPTFAALGLATAFWHVAYSRIAFRALSNPMVEALALAFLWRALRTTRWRDFLLAGFFIGGLIYTYLAGRFVPLALILFFTAEAIIAWRAKRRPLFWLHWPKLAGMVGAAALVFAPLGFFFAQNPAAFVDRAGSVSIFSPAMNQGDFWGTLWQTILTTLGTFVALTGDPNSLGNIPGKPELGPLLAIFFGLGIGLVLFRVWDFGIRGKSQGETAKLGPYLFLLIWWPTMLLPAILAPEDAPHHLRLIGAAPATYILVGLGMGQATKFVSRLIEGVGGQRSAVNHQIGWLLLIVVFGLTAVQTYRDYFIRWATEIDHYMDFDLYAEELAAQITAERDPTLAYVIPMDLRAAHEARHYSLDFLYRGEIPFTYVVVDEATVSSALARAAQGKTTLKVVRWTADKHREADAKEIVTYLLETNADLVDRQSFPVYDVETYTLKDRPADFSPPSPTFALPTIDQPVGVTFDSLLRLDAAFIPSTVSPGDWLPVALTFAPLAQMDADYKASLRLIDSTGERVSQKDRLLMHNFHQGTSLWTPETVNEYYLLSVPPETPSGEYTVVVVIYHPDTQVPLMADGLAEIPLRTVQVE